MIFSDAEMIEDLQMVTCLGRAIVDGRAVLFELLPFEEDEEIKIIASLILLRKFLMCTVVILLLSGQKRVQGELLIIREMLLCRQSIRKSSLIILEKNIR